LVLVLALGACGGKDAATSNAPPTATATPRSVVTLTSSQTREFYLVDGTTTNDIFDSMAGNGLTSRSQQATEEFIVGLTQVSWSFETSNLEGFGSCSLTSAAIDLRFTVTLPRHSAPETMSESQAARWRDFVADTAAHEQTHVDLYLTSAQTLREVIDAKHRRSFSDCTALDSLVDFERHRAESAGDRAQERFHDDEAVRSATLRQPLELAIAHTETKMRTLKGELDVMAGTKDGLDAEIESLKQESLPFQAQMAAIERSFPGLVLPDRTYDQYELARTRLNSLNDQSNQLIQELNGIIVEENEAAKAYNSTIEQLDEMDDSLAWLP
jgi:predicted secreted Zn-dependent protease